MRPLGVLQHRELHLPQVIAPTVSGEILDVISSICSRVAPSSTFQRLITCVSAPTHDQRAPEA
jgi:hypothetical protein